MSTSKKSVRSVDMGSANNRSAQVLRALLQKSMAQDGVLDPRIATGCTSQTALAHLDLPDLKIKPMSLNTLKSASAQCLPGGFRELDRLRRSALDAFRKVRQERSTPSSQSTHRSQELHASELRDQRQRLVDSCAFAADQYNELLGLFRRALERADKGRLDSDNERRLLEAHLARFRGARAQPLVLIEGGLSESDRQT